MLVAAIGLLRVYICLHVVIVLLYVSYYMTFISFILF